MEVSPWVRKPAEGRLERGSQGLDAGDRIHVKLVHTEVDHIFIDFARATEAPSCVTVVQ